MISSINNFDLSGECAGSANKKHCAEQNKNRAVSYKRARERANARNNKYHIMPFIVKEESNSRLKHLMNAAFGVVAHWQHKTGVSWNEIKQRAAANRIEGSPAELSCHDLGLALDGAGVVTSSTRLATVWIPGVGETMLLVGGGIDLAGVASDLLGEKGVC